MVMDVPAAFLFADSACSEAEHVSQTHTHRDDTDMAGYPDPHLLQWLTPQARGVYIPALTLVAAPISSHTSHPSSRQDRGQDYTER